MCVRVGEGREKITHLGTLPAIAVAWPWQKRYGNQREIILNLFLISLRAPASGLWASWRADLKITVIQAVILSSWMHLLPASSASLSLSSRASEGEMTSARLLSWVWDCLCTASDVCVAWTQADTLLQTRGPAELYETWRAYWLFLPSRLILVLRYLQNKAHNLGYMLHTPRILSCPSGTQNAFLVMPLHSVSFPQCPCLCPCLSIQEMEGRNGLMLGTPKEWGILSFDMNLH